MPITTSNRYSIMSSEEKGNICDNNQEIIQELILRRDKHEPTLKQNLHQNENKTSSEKVNQ